MVIYVNVTDKRATVTGAPVIVCGNSGYTVEFTFDDEWAGLEAKTARFVYVQEGEVKYQDVVFTENTAAVPVLANTKEVRVGVFAGDLQTSTPAVIPCELSIRCGTGAPADPTPSQYDQIIALLTFGGGGSGGGAPLRVRLIGTEEDCSQNILDHQYTAEGLYAIAATRDIVLESYGIKNNRTLYGYYRYSRGSETSVVFEGWFENVNGRVVPATAIISANGYVTIGRNMFAEGTLKTDTTLTVSGSAADACAVGNMIRSISTGGGLSATEKNLILSLFKNAAYTTNMSATIAQLETLWSGGDVPDVPVEPDIPDTPTGGATATDDGNGNITVTGATATDDGNGNITVIGATATDDGNGNIIVS